MTRQDFLKGIYVIENSYQNFKISDKPETLMVWYEMFKDDSEAVFANAIKQVLATSKFSPTIAALREAIQEITNPVSSFTADDAWGEVTRAMRKFGWYRPEEALASMSPITRTIIKSIGFREICISENQMADRAHFMKMFEQYKEREKKEYLLPEGVRADTEKLTSAKSLIKQIGHDISRYGKTN